MSYFKVIWLATLIPSATLILVCHVTGSGFSDMEIFGWPLFCLPQMCWCGSCCGLWLCGQAVPLPSAQNLVYPLPSKTSFPITSILRIVYQHSLYVLTFHLLPALLFHQNSSQKITRETFLSAPHGSEKTWTPWSLSPANIIFLGCQDSTLLFLLHWWLLCPLRSTGNKWESLSSNLGSATYWLCDLEEY